MTPEIGQRLRVIRDIYDDGCEGHHPPGYYAMIGDIVIVRKLRADGNVQVSHEGVSETFYLLDSEWREEPTP